MRESVARVVESFLTEADAALGAGYSAVLYGSAARGDFVPGRSEHQPHAGDRPAHPTGAPLPRPRLHRLAQGRPGAAAGAEPGGMGPGHRTRSPSRSPICGPRTRFFAAPTRCRGFGSTRPICARRSSGSSGASCSACARAMLPMLPILPRSARSASRAPRRFWCCCAACSRLLGKTGSARLTRARRGGGRGHRVRGRASAARRPPPGGPRVAL